MEDYSRLQKMAQTREKEQQTTEFDWCLEHNRGWNINVRFKEVWDLIMYDFEYLKFKDFKLLL